MAWRAVPERWDFGQGFGECPHQSVIFMIDDGWVGYFCCVCVCGGCGRPLNWLCTGPLLITKIPWRHRLVRSPDSSSSLKVGLAPVPTGRDLSHLRLRIIVVAGPAGWADGPAWPTVHVPVHRVRRGSALPRDLSGQVLAVSAGHLQAASRRALLDSEGGFKLSDRRQACPLLNSFGRSMAC